MSEQQPHEEGSPSPSGGEGGDKHSTLIPSGAKKKIGPLPLWAWGVVAAGVLGALLVIRKARPSPGSSSTAGTLTPPVDPGATTGGVVNPAAPNPLTESGLLNALQTMVKDIENLRAQGPQYVYSGNSGYQGPNLGPTPGPGDTLSAINTSHTAGGTSTARTADSGHGPFSRARAAADSVAANVKPPLEQSLTGPHGIATRTFYNGQATQDMVTPPTTINTRRADLVENRLGFSGRGRQV
jgi:hypothetical protein